MRQAVVRAPRRACGGALFLKERVDRRLVAAAVVTIGGVMVAIVARVV